MHKKSLPFTAFFQELIMIRSTHPQARPCAGPIPTTSFLAELKKLFSAMVQLR